MNNILVFTPAYKEQTSQNMADFIKFCKDDLTLLIQILIGMITIGPMPSFFLEIGKLQLLKKVLQKHYNSHCSILLNLIFDIH